MKEKVTVALLVLFVFAGIASATDATAGKDLFSGKCAMCHGADASANTAMGKNMKIRDLHSPEVQKQSDAELTTIITKGKNKMPSFDGKLTADQINQVVAFIRTLK